MKAAPRKPLNYTPEAVEFVEKWAVDLHPQDAQFVRHYLISFSQQEAALAIGMAPTSARSNAYRYMRRPDILKAIAMAMSERAESLNITAATVLQEAYRAFLIAMEDKQYSAARGFLEMVGKHVNVQAFSAKYNAPQSTDEDEREVEQLTENLTLEELETLAALARKSRGSDPSPVLN